MCLLHSYADPRHERRVAAALRRELPDAFVVASHEIAAECREYERASTVSVDAYLGPRRRALPPPAGRGSWPSAGCPSRC